MKGRPIVTRSFESQTCQVPHRDRPCQREIPLQRGSLPSSPSPAPCSALFRGPRAYIHQERMLSEPVTLEDGRNVVGGDSLKNVLPAGEAGLVFLKPQCSHAISGSRVLAHSLALDRPDQDISQIPERLFCCIHPTAMGCAGLLFLFYSYCVHFRDEMPRSKGTNWPRASGVALV